ncbi:larval cuticle protein 65Ag1-like [Ischnura elegans]|uniref:larval cuticle protein 65Ag1-like n=1 Tax=Ischnura elegans TaxID=197161 RepID=UPI001ED88B05|nr:larval cuticle protein 65Ag1-like [Ischnura elegans]
MNSLKLALFFALVAVAVARPQFRTTVARPTFTRDTGVTGTVVPVLERDETRDEAGQFTLRYVTGDGITVNEVGRLVENDEGDGHVLVKEGSYTYTSPEGQTFTVTYTSDKQGFRAEGAHLPVAPVV